MLGPPRITVDEGSIDLPPGKTSALLYYLAYKNNWVSRDELVYLFWPESDEASARKNLRQLLTTLRRLPYTEQLEIENTRLRWPVHTDAHAFKEALAREAWATAGELYQGPLLQDFQAADLPDFEEWLELERQDLQKLHREGVLTLAEELITSNRYAPATDVLAGYRKHDPLDEEVLRRVLQVHYGSGQPNKALETFEAFKQSLERELGGEPEERTLQLVAELKEAPAAAPTAPAQARHNLPVQPTPLLGRDVEAAEVSERLTRPGCRVLTLTGPGGIGKTRLSLEVAGRLAESDVFADGVWFVPLSTVTTAELLVTSIADALRFSFYGAAEPKAQLFEHLRDKNLLLVLDNFEQLVSASPLVAELLATCPDVKVFVTSREVLRLRGEQEFPVPPLALPDLGHLPLGEHLSQYAAVQLFIERALAVKADFAVTNENAPAVAEICHRLDGLPLAIELAAARVKLFPPQALLARLAAGPLKLLSGGARDLPARQQTLRSTIEWSYNLLDPQEQTLFVRLAVFVGGRSLEAIEAVCNADGELDDVIANLSSLIDKSLVRQEEVSGEPRFVMLKTIYDYAREQLEASGEADTLKRRHAEFFLALAEEAEFKSRSPDHASWLDRLETEHDNFRAALTRAKTADKEHALRLAGALGNFWDYRGHDHEARQWYDRLLTRPVTVSPAVLAKNFLCAGALAVKQADYAAASSWLEQSLSLYEQLDDKGNMAEALLNLAIVVSDQGNYAEGEALFRKSLKLKLEIGDEIGAARLQANLGEVAYYKGAFEEAMDLHSQALATFQKYDSKAFVSVTLNNLGAVALELGNYTSADEYLTQSGRLAKELGLKLTLSHNLVYRGQIALGQGDVERAHKLFEEALAILEDLENKRTAAVAINFLGEVARRRGDLKTARSYCARSLQLRMEIGKNYGDLSFSLQSFASLALSEGSFSRAARLWGTAIQLFETQSTRLPYSCLRQFEKDIATLRAHLGEATFDALWAEGQAMTLEQAIACALETDAEDEQTD